MLKCPFIVPSGVDERLPALTGELDVCRDKLLNGLRCGLELSLRAGLL